MTVKMTSVKPRCVVFLMIFVMAQCVPLDFTTSRYNEENVELQDNITLSPPLYSNIQEAPPIFDIPSLESLFLWPNDNLNLNYGRNSKSPQNTDFHSEEILRNFRTVSFNNNDSFFGNSTISTNEPDEDARRFSSNIMKDTKKNKTHSNREDFRTSNRSNNTKVKSTNSPHYTNFSTNPVRHPQTLKPISNNSNNKPMVSRKPGMFEIKVQKPTTPKPKKFLTITRKPIIINLTRVPIVTKPTTKTTRTPGWISKIKSSTPAPTSSTKSNTIGWPNTKIKNKNDWNRYKNYTELQNLNIRKKPTSPSTTSNKKKKPSKPTRVKYTAKPGRKPTIEEIKQNWYESGVPYPNPMPEIISNSQTFPLPPAEEAPTGDSDSVQVDAEEDNPITNPISTFNLDMRPAVTNLKDTVGSSSSGCPTVHISSSVLSPQQRQECSDLNLVINSHFHQNTANDRVPSIDTYQAENPEEDIPVEAVEEPVEEVADAGVAQADPGGALADPAGAAGTQADSAGGGSPGGVGGTGGSGANGGNGGNGGDGGDSGLGWPDVKGILDTIDWIGNKFGGIFSFLKNPYLYLIPAALFFLLGFFLIIALFPWWIPLLFLFVGIKAKQKPNIVHHKHIHKPIQHPDGWFWNQHTKTWENVQDYLHRRRIDNVNLNHIPQAIDQFGKKYTVRNPVLKQKKV